MPKLSAPFPVNMTIDDVTYYTMYGKSFARKKSNLTRKRVLRSPCFEKTRHYAGMMGKASRIGSAIYQALPKAWRQGWMYRAFTGEALQFLKDGKTVEDTTKLMWERYVNVLKRKDETGTSNVSDAIHAATQPPIGRRRKPDPRVLRLQQYSNLLKEASKIASLMYRSLPVEERQFVMYRVYVGEAMRVLKADEKKSKAAVQTSDFPSTLADIVHRRPSAFAETPSESFSCV